MGASQATIWYTSGTSTQHTVEVAAGTKTKNNCTTWNGATRKQLERSVYYLGIFFPTRKIPKCIFRLFFSEFSHFLKLFFDINTASISLNQSSFVKICCSWRGIDDFSTLLTFPCIAGMWQGVICDLGRRGIMIHISGKGVYYLGVMFFFRGNIITGGLLFERGTSRPPVNIKNSTQKTNRTFKKMHKYMLYRLYVYRLYITYKLYYT